MYHPISLFINRYYHAKPNWSHLLYFCSWKYQAVVLHPELCILNIWRLIQHLLSSLFHKWQCNLCLRGIRVKIFLFEFGIRRTNESYNIQTRLNHFLLQYVDSIYVCYFLTEWKCGLDGKEMKIKTNHGELMNVKTIANIECVQEIEDNT